MSNDAHILIVGDSRLATLVANGIGAKFVATIEDAVSLLDKVHFDVIALAFPRRGVFSADDVQLLNRRAPLARVVAVAGPWCEGPWRRDFDLLGGATMIPSHRWAAWLAENSALLRRRLPAAWSLPVTTGNDELAEHWSRGRLPSRQGLIAIHSPSRDAAEAIGDTLALAGFAIAWQSPSAEHLLHGAAAIVIEADGWNETVADEITALRRQSPGTPVALLLNFPLIADIRAAKAAGAGVVLAKPFTSDEFLGQLEILLTQPPIANQAEAA